MFSRQKYGDTFSSSLALIEERRPSLVLGFKILQPCIRADEYHSIVLRGRDQFKNFHTFLSARRHTGNIPMVRHLQLNQRKDRHILAESSVKSLEGTAIIEAL